MSANPPVPQQENFDAAVDTFLAGAAPATQDAPAEEAAPPVVEPAQPATETTPEATTATQDDDSDDETLTYDARFLRAQKREERLAREREEAKAEAEAEKRKAWSHQGNLLQEQKRREALQAERDDFERRLKDEEARIDGWWQDAIAAAPDDQKQAYREAYALDKEKRGVAQERQQIDLQKQQADTQRKATQQENEQLARFLATAELDLAIPERAKAEGLPPELFQPVREYVASPVMKKLAQVLPLRVNTTLPGDPATWPLEKIDDLDKLRRHLEAQAEAGYAYFVGQHAQGKAQAEQARVQENAKAATKTYQPEKPIGTAGGPSRRSFEEMDFDEAVDAFFPNP